MKRTVPPLPVFRLQTGGALADAKTSGTRLFDEVSIDQVSPDANALHDFARPATLIPFLHRLALIYWALDCRHSSRSKVLYLSKIDVRKCWSGSKR